MKKYSAHIIDQMLLFIAVILITSTLLNYLKIRGVISLLISCAVSLIFCIVLHKKYKEKYNISANKSCEQKHKTKCMELLQTYPEVVLYHYFSKALKAELVEKNGLPIHILYNGEITLIYGICTYLGTFLSEMMLICRFYKTNKIRVLMLSPDIAHQLPPAITNKIQIDFINFDKIYIDLKVNKTFPLIKPTTVEHKNKTFSKFFLSVNIKPFLLAGISLIIFSKFISLSWYYIAVGCCSIIFAIISLILSIKNKNKTVVQ